VLKLSQRRWWLLPGRYVLRCSSFVLLLICFSAGGVIASPQAENVLVLYNEDIPESVEIANYYAAARPGVNLWGLEDIPDDEQISASEYLDELRPQILAGLTPEIDVIVTTTGLPLRIRAESPLRAGRYASFESELTRIDSINTESQMINQDWGLPDIFGGNSLARNPYYGSGEAFSYQSTGMRLASRIDGYTVADAKALVDRGTNAYFLPDAGVVVVDDDPVSRPDRMFQLATEVLPAAGQGSIYDTSAAAITSAEQLVVGYVSHGTNDSGALGRDYIVDDLQFDLAPGAVFATQESYNAFSFDVSGSTRGQGQLAQWVAIGGSGGVGHVEEPAVGSTNVANSDLLFEGLLNGQTWAEAAWSSIFQLSYVNTVLGDPLMTWGAWVPGDANFDGKVGVGDVAILASNFGQTGNLSNGDFNNSGRVDVGDIGILAANFGSSDGGPPSMNILAIPEPSSLGMLLLGGALFVRNRQSCRGRKYIA